MDDVIARADALRLRAEAEADPAAVAEAVALLRDVPRAQQDAVAVPLSAALRALGALTDDLDALNSAVVLAREAVRTAPSPRAHAVLGAALTVLGERAGDPDLLAEALGAYKAAAAGFAATGAEIDHARMGRNRGAVLTLLATVLDDPSLLAEAAVSLRAARIAFTALDAPQEEALAADNLCHSLRLLGERRGDPALLAEAVAAGRAALAATPPDAPPRQRAMTETNLANALAALGGERRVEALALYRAALARLDGPAAAVQRATVRHNLRLAEQVAD